MNYYDENAEEFFENTVNADMTPHYKKFLEAIPEGCHILDAGCGSGRDTLKFMEMGYEVTPLDASEKMCRLAAKYTHHEVIYLRFQYIQFKNMFDAIWASASLLHVPSDEMDMVLSKLHDSLVDDGILYASFKYGNYEGTRNGRYFTDLTEETARKLFVRNNFEVLDTWITEDVRKDRKEEKWVNILVKKIL
ncbi:MAG: class I SAM-dependent methyltransferase [Methanosphaera sp.]|nr:class I SAM-dependent methyltransferase [Methanosphaera sp.]